MGKERVVVFSVTNDLQTDQRVDKMCNLFVNQGYQVILVGRKRENSRQLEKRNYQTVRFSMWINKGPLFYLTYNLRLFFFLLNKKVNILYANDLDTLLANYLVSKIKKLQLIYDTHEYFTEVPELINRKIIQSTWSFIERKIFPRLKHVITVNQSIAEVYQKKYGVDIDVVRNLPIRIEKVKPTINIKVEGQKIIIYQGAINVHRGIEYMVEAMQYLDNTILWIIGDGDIRKDIEDLVNKLNLNDKVKMPGVIPFQKLNQYTRQADLGLSLEEDKGLNYHYALPNKLFDYIQAEIPVLVSPLIEMKNIVEHYQVGELLISHIPRQIAEQINELLSNNQKILQWKANAKIAAKELCWENEQQKVNSLLKEII